MSSNFFTPPLAPESYLIYRTIIFTRKHDRLELPRNFTWRWGERCVVLWANQSHAIGTSEFLPVEHTITIEVHALEHTVLWQRVFGQGVVRCDPCHGC
jgi:hypothetical protein